MKKLIIIPAYNEQDAILNTYNSIIEFNKKNDYDLDVIVINDGSKDNTEKILCDNNIPHVQLIHNLGIGGAVQTGYKYALMNDYDVAIQFDGDGQHDINSIIGLITPILEGNADFCIGSRFVEGAVSEFKSSFARRQGIKLISSFIKMVTGNKLYDVTSGYRAANKKIIHEFAHEYPTEYPEPITNAEICKKGYIVNEIPVYMNERQGGTSSIRAWKNFYYMFNILLSVLLIKFRRFD